VDVIDGAVTQALEPAVGDQHRVHHPAQQRQMGERRVGPGAAAERVGGAVRHPGQEHPRAIDRVALADVLDDVVERLGVDVLAHQRPRAVERGR